MGSAIFSDKQKVLSPVFWNVLNKKSIALFLKVIYNNINDIFVNYSLIKKSKMGVTLWFRQNKEILYYCYCLSGGR